MLRTSVVFGLAGPAALVLAVALGTGRAPAPPPNALGTGTAVADTMPEGRRDGEYGLWVEEAGGRLTVHWITSRCGPGFLAVEAGGRVVRADTTPSSCAHAVAFDRPDAHRLLLRYGATDDAADRHATLVAPGEPKRRPWKLPAVDSLYVLGDVHGEYGDMLAVLGNAGLVDSAGAWVGGTGHLAVVGDMLDRGPDARRVLWYLYGLERQAAAAGGGVHVLLGNHEVMVMGNDLRYTTPKELSIAAAFGTDYWRLFDPQQTVLGRWLAALPAVIQIGDVLLAHGGVAPSFAGAEPGAVNDSMALFLKEPLFRRWADSTVVVEPMDSTAFNRRFDMFWADGSVLWFRGYLLSDTLGPGLDAVLRRYGATVHVVGHTPLPTILQRYGGRLIDVDMLRPATEMLLLAREGRQWRRYRIRETGEPEDLGLGAAAASPQG